MDCTYFQSDLSTIRQVLAEASNLLDNISVDSVHDNANQKRDRSGSRGREGKKNKSGTPSKGPNPFMQAIERPLKAAADPIKTIQPPIKIVLDKYFFDINLKSHENFVEYKDIAPESEKFQSIRSMFPSCMVVLKIQQVFNPFLRLSFHLKQELKYNNIGPLKLFHGTKLKYVHNICKFNFDWRFSGAVKGHKFGRGVNFTSRPKFAMNFCDQESVRKVMILSEVLVLEKIYGDHKMVVPPDDCDTSIGDKNSVFVKFDDAEMYPSYVIFFCKAKDLFPKWY